MELSQEVELPVSLPVVWKALNDPDILRQSLTGCEEFNPIDENKFEIRILVKVGPVKARFAGEVELHDIKELESCTMKGQGKGGVAGFAKGEARVSLRKLESDSGELTALSYTVKAMVGGKLAQLGSRLIDGAAKKMADEFFENFSALVTDYTA